MKRAAFLFAIAALGGCATTPAATGPRPVTLAEVQSIAACRTDPEATQTREECDCIVQAVFARSQEPGVLEGPPVDPAIEDAEAARLNALTALFGAATEECDAQP